MLIHLCSSTYPGSGDILLSKPPTSKFAYPLDLSFVFKSFKSNRPGVSVLIVSAETSLSAAQGLNMKIILVWRRQEDTAWTLPAQNDSMSLSRQKNDQTIVSEDFGAYCVTWWRIILLFIYTCNSSFSAPPASSSRGLEQRRGRY